VAAGRLLAPDGATERGGEQDTDADGEARVAHLPEETTRAAETEGSA
jgi:hypothetical protein